MRSAVESAKYSDSATVPTHCESTDGSKNCKDASALAILPKTQQSWELTEHERYFDEPNFYNQRTGEAFMRWRIPEEKVDRSQEVQLPMEPGDAAYFTNYTWHRADPNASGEHKMAYAIAYQLSNDSDD